MEISAFSLTIIGLLVVYVILRIWREECSRRPLPPGPKGFPVLGNIRDMPKPGDHEYHHWTEHKDLYGPISSITVLGRTVVIINDPNIAFELLRDRSSIYSSRPHLNFCCDHVGWRYAAGMSPYNDYWKTQRKGITKVASSKTSLSVFDRVQEEETAHFLMKVLANPDRLFDHIRDQSASVILKITYGYTASSLGQDPLVYLVEAATLTFIESSLPGKWAVDTFPFLEYLPDWFPGTGYRKIGREMRKTVSDCLEKPYAFVKQQMRDKRAKTSFVSQSIETIGDDQEKESMHKWTALSLFIAGADTVFFLAMTLYPEVQKKAQEELDRVIGSSRLPVAADKDALPYIHAVMLETHRWHPIAPLGMPHRCDSEDFCRGYRIPKGTTILANTWWFTHDPNTYADPMTFNPDRFIKTETHIPEADPRQFIFGYGRRICPGRYVADNALFLTIAQSLAVFDIRPTDVIPEARFEPGMASPPVPYETRITPRSAAHKELIEGSEEKYPWEESDAEELENMV